MGSQLGFIQQPDGDLQPVTRDSSIRPCFSDDLLRSLVGNWLWIRRAYADVERHWPLKDCTVLEIWEGYTRTTKPIQGAAPAKRDVSAGEAGRYLLTSTRMDRLARDFPDKESAFDKLILAIFSEILTAGIFRRPESPKQIEDDLTEVSQCAENLINSLKKLNSHAGADYGFLLCLQVQRTLDEMRGFHKLCSWSRYEVDLLINRNANETWRFVEELAALARMDRENLKLRKDYRPGQVNKMVRNTVGRAICRCITEIYGDPWPKRGVTWPMVVELAQIVLNDDSVDERMLRNACK